MKNACSLNLKRVLIAGVINKNVPFQKKMLGDCTIESGFKLRCCFAFVEHFLVLREQVVAFVLVTLHCYITSSGTSYSEFIRRQTDSLFNAMSLPDYLRTMFSFFSHISLCIVDVECSRRVLIILLDF